MHLGIDASNIRAGGGVTHLVELLRAARPREHGFDQVVVWGGAKTLGLLPRQPWLTPVHESLLDGPLPLRTFWQKFRLTGLASQACDLLLAPGGLYHGNFHPYVSMSQNLLPFAPDDPNRDGLSWARLRMLLLRRHQASSFVQADGVIFLTRYAEKVVRRQLPRFNSPAVVIPHGVHREFFRSPQPITAFSAQRPLTLLYVSWIWPYKHQAEVAQAVAELRREGLPVRLDLVGPAVPKARERLQRELRQLDPAGAYLRYLGAFPYEKMAPLYHAADLFIFASGCETISMPLMEAMASGLPIACADRGPMPEVLGDAGVYFNPDDPEDIANTLRKMILSPDLRAGKAQAAYTRAQMYSWERCATATFAFLAEVADKVCLKGV
jgi:glycosyltransferase involved in cell wall biosynthesis